ncbi:MAG: tryptophan synthase subunit alpha [Candidatus Zixiibacteriota bacterium]|nr:MAG: tryptophan synthase subunit alpha [candidate division Zixibacteria bacterium]HHI03149.1 tryptophan synthase subunit alpha [candidate division Zixibacteria bacterium]
MQNLAPVSITHAFEKCRKDKRTALMPYLTAGYPDDRTFVMILGEMIKAGADMIEIGIPFSDPLADGKTIQSSSQTALHNGTNLDRIFRQLRKLESRYEVPLIIMSYYNPVLQYGLSKFLKKSISIGGRGLIIPDIIPDEGTAIEKCCRRSGVDLIYLLAPTSNAQRRRLIIDRSRGFIYLISVAGVTGARKNLPKYLNRWIARIKKESRLPVCVGFGISDLSQAQSVARVADGVIIGSAVIDIIKKSSGSHQAVSKTGRFIRKIREGLNNV